LAESYFNMAELADKGFISAGDGGQSMYESGITASFLYLGLTAAQASSYYSQGLVGWSSATNKQETIITQKWIAVNGITAEQSWFDYNRTGFPTGLPISLLASTSDRPVRLMYVASVIII
jgi:Starch-binding associating with outer membrane